MIAEPGATEYTLSYKDGVLINKEQIKMEPIISSHELTKEKLPAMAEEFTSGPWIEGASRFLDFLVQFLPSFLQLPIQTAQIGYLFLI